MSLPQYLHMIVPYRVVDQFNNWHILLPQYLQILSYRIFDQFSNWEMLLPRYLQTFVSILVSADVTVKLSKDIYKTRVLQKNRKGVLELNWAIPEWVREKAHVGFDKYSTLLGGFGINQNILNRKQVEKVLRLSKRCIRLRLWSILSPGRMVSLELSEIVDIQEIHSLMNNLYKFIHVPIHLTDVKGNVLANVGWLNSYATFYNFHYEICKHCIESDINVSTKVSSGEFKLYKCKNNMWEIVAPIKVGGQHVGNIHAGQFFFEDESVDHKLLLSQARQDGFNLEEYIVEFEKIPRLSMEAVDKAIDFLLAFANLIDNKYIPCPISWLIFHLKIILSKCTRF